MKKIKAVVLEKSGSRYTVLAENGTFRHVQRRQNVEVGEEIEIQLASLEGFGALRAWAGVAALFLLVLTTLFAWNLYQAPTAVALLSVDINPSIQFTIDEQGNLLKIKTKNEDAERLISKIELKGEPIAKVLEQIVTEAHNQNFLNPEQPWIVVGYSPLIIDTSEQADKNLSEDQIVSWLKKDTEENGFTPQVTFFALTPQDRELAQRENLTLGEYALWQTAEKAGVNTQPEKLRDTLERVELLENPKVQAQVKADKKGHEYPSVEGRMLDKGKDQESENKQQNKKIEDRKKDEKSEPEGNDSDKGIGSDRNNEIWNNKDIRIENDRKGIENEKDKGQQGKGDGDHISTRGDKAANKKANLPSFLRIGNPSSLEYELLQTKGENKPKNDKLDKGSLDGREKR